VAITAALRGPSPRGSWSLGEIEAVVARRHTLYDSHRCVGGVGLVPQGLRMGVLEEFVEWLEPKWKDYDIQGDNERVSAGVWEGGRKGGTAWL